VRSVKIHDAHGARGTQAVPAVRVTDLEITYPDADRPAVRRVSFEAWPGELVLVMGATGAGKSTLIKSLARIVPSFQAASVQGSVAIFGDPVDGRGVPELAGTVGVIFQDFEAQLFSTNVLCEVAFAMEQLGTTPPEMPTRAMMALNAVGLGDCADRDPATLSGGEKQRLAIASMLALEPPILLLDEPTTDLDPVGTAEVLGLLDAMRREGRTVIVVEHEIAAAAIADRMLLLRDGEVVAYGCPRELLPQVALLEECGVRPHDVARILAVLDAGTFEWPPVTEGSAYSDQLLDAAHRVLSGRGFGAPAPGGATESSGPVSAIGPPRVVVHDVSFEYRVGVQALDRVTLTLHAGEFVALIGQNGSGKTTLAKHLNGLLRPTVGRVELDGTALDRIPPGERAALVGFVFQDPDHQLFAATAAEEVAFGPTNLGLPVGEIERRTRSALDAVGLGHRGSADPFLLDKGERQRLAVASVLSLEPAIMILDEPTTGLDYREQCVMMDLLMRLNAEGMTVVIITHSPWVVAEYASRAILMVGGQVIWDDSLRALFERPELLERAKFRVPDVTALGHRFGVSALTVEELATRLRGRGTS
jgi:energy-coupling factor transporter ATP-binding protein EcfA2